MSYLHRHGTAPTPQSEPMRPDQVPNSAGGWAWDTEPYMRAKRFLILGTEGGTYYAGERDLTRENIDGLRWCIQNDGLALVQEIVTISESGRAAKNDPAIFALALAATEGELPVRQAALDALPAVCRTGTHLFMFCSFIDALGGWGRAKRRAVSRWYTEKPPKALAYQLVKYRQRDGWTHRDVLRLSHPKTDISETADLLAWATHRTTGRPAYDGESGLDVVSAHFRMIEGFERAQTAKTPEETVQLIQKYALPREALKTEHLSDPGVWETLLGMGMPLTAMIRNLATMTRIGLLTPHSDATKLVLHRLGQGDQLQRARVHPINVLAAQYTYQAGHGLRGRNTWTPVTQIVDALDAAFYLTFGNVQPSGMRHLLALDVSGSMASGAVMGIPGLTPRVMSAALALVTMSAEPETFCVGFSHQLVPLTISPRQRLDDVIRTISRIPFGGTDCALPMLTAIEQNAAVDAFAIYTDSETWYGHIHPAHALVRYRQHTGLYASLAVVGMVGNRFTIADPQDEKMLDCVGFDTSTPQLLSDFAAGRF